MLSRQIKQSFARNLKHTANVFGQRQASQSWQLQSRKIKQEEKELSAASMGGLIDVYNGGYRGFEPEMHVEQMLPKQFIDVGQDMRKGNPRLNPLKSFKRDQLKKKRRGDATGVRPEEKRTPIVSGVRPPEEKDIKAQEQQAKTKPFGKELKEYDAVRDRIAEVEEMNEAFAKANNYQGTTTAGTIGQYLDYQAKKQLFLNRALEHIGHLSPVEKEYRLKQLEVHLEHMNFADAILASARHSIDPLGYQQKIIDLEREMNAQLAGHHRRLRIMVMRRRQARRNEPQPEPQMPPSTVTVEEVPEAEAPQPVAQQPEQVSSSHAVEEMLAEAGAAAGAGAEEVKEGEGVDVVAFADVLNEFEGESKQRVEACIKGMEGFLHKFFVGKQVDGNTFTLQNMNELLSEIENNLVSGGKQELHEVTSAMKSEMKKLVSTLPAAEQPPLRAALKVFMGASRMKNKDLFAYPIIREQLEGNLLSMKGIKSGMSGNKKSSPVYLYGTVTDVKKNINEYYVTVNGNFTGKQIKDYRIVVKID